MLGEIAQINPSLERSLRSDELISFVPMAAVDAETASTTPGQDRTFEQVRRGFTPFLNGDLLVAKITPSFENGKIAQATLRHEVGFGSTEFHVVRPVAGKTDGRYLLHFLRQDQVRRNGTRRMTGSAGQRRVPEKFLSSLEVPLPDLTEQRRIAEMLDRVHALRAKRREVLRHLESLKAEVFDELFGNLVFNEKSWPTAVLGDIARFVGGGTPSRARREYFAGPIRWATAKDIRFPYLDDTEEHITEQAVRESATNLVPAGTILVVVKSKILANRLPVAVARSPTCFGQDLKGIQIEDRADVSFVATALRVGQRWLLDRARGVNTEGLTLEHLRAFPLPQPPIGLQREFARRLSRVEELGATQQRSLAALTELYRSLQHGAFRTNM